MHFSALVFSSNLSVVVLMVANVCGCWQKLRGVALVQLGKRRRVEYYYVQTELDSTVFILMKRKPKNSYESRLRCTAQRLLFLLHRTII